MTDPIDLEALRAALVEAVGTAADTLDNLIHAMAMPLPDELHMKALRLALPDLLEEMRAALLPFQRSDDKGDAT